MVGEVRTRRKWYERLHSRNGTDVPPPDGDIRLDYLMGIFSDPVAMRYYPGTKSRQEVEEWVRWTLASYRDHGFGLWVAILKDSGGFAGQCGLTVQEVEGDEEVEIAR